VDVDVDERTLEMSMLFAALLTVGSFIDVSRLPDQTPAGVPVATGRVVHYAPGVFRAVAANRGMKLLGWVDGYVSTRKCERVDTRADPTLKSRPWLVMASINGRPAEIHQVVDCSDPHDLPTHIRTGLILEVDAATGIRNGVEVPNNKVKILRIWRP
jgi:hypothetical protein